MKRITTYFAFIFFLVYPVILSGQTDTTDRKFVIKADLLLPAISLLNPSKGMILGLSSEYFLKRNSINLSGYYYWNNVDYIKSKTIQIIPSYRFYLGHNLNKGFFTGGYLKYSNHEYKDYATPLINVQELSLDYAEKSMSFGGLAGFHVTKFRFKFELLIGLGLGKVLNTKIFKNEVGYFENQNMKLDGILSLNIGYRL
jgi:hypothetical protein